MNRRPMGAFMIVTSLVTACFAAGCADSEQSWTDTREGLGLADPDFAVAEGPSIWTARRFRPFSCDRSVWAGDVVISSAQDLEQLIGTVTVTGRVTIDASSLTNLDGLECLQEVESLEIVGNQALVDVSGLRGLAAIRGDLSVVGNGKLTDLDGLGSLVTVGGSLRLLDNPKLEDVDGLISLEQVNGMIHIRNNDRIVSLDGLGELAFVGDSLVLQANDSLADLGMFGLDFVGGDLWFMGNPRLSHCEIRDLFAQLSAGQFTGEVHAVGNSLAGPCP